MNIKKLIVEAIKNKLDENYDSPDTPKWSKRDIENAAINTKKGDLDVDALDSNETNNVHDQVITSDKYMEVLKPKLLKFMPYLSSYYNTCSVDHVVVTRFTKLFQMKDGVKGEALVNILHDIKTKSGSITFMCYIPNEHDPKITDETKDAIKHLEKYTIRVEFKNNTILQAVLKVDINIKGANKVITHLADKRISEDLDENYDSPDTPKWLKTQISRAADFKKSDQPNHVPSYSDFKDNVLDKTITPKQYQDIVIPRIKKVMPYLDNFEFIEGEQSANKDFFTLIFKKDLQVVNGGITSLLLQVHHDIKDKKGTIVIYFHTPKDIKDKADETDKAALDVLRKYLKSISFANNTFLQTALQVDTLLKSANRYLKGNNKTNIIS
jgi:phage gpG-like protein